MEYSRFVMVTALAIVLGLPVVTHADQWIQTDWSGGPGQEQWGDPTMFYESDTLSFERIPGDLFLDAPNTDAWETGFGLDDPTWAYCIIENSDGAFFVGTRDKGNVYKSTTYGVSWGNTTDLENAIEIHDLLETESGKTLAGAYRASNMGAAIFVSTDNGSSWDTTGDISAEKYIYHIIEASTGDLYAATDGAVYKSTDDGDTWVETGELTGANHVNALLEYQGSLLAATDPGAAIFKSTDWGDSWNETGDLADAERAWCFTVDGSANIYVGTSFNGDVFKSTDGGDSWTNTGDILGAKGVYGLLYSREGVLYAGSTHQPLEGKVSCSTDGGTSWFDTGDLAGSFEVWEMIQSSHGPIYACSSPATFALFTAGHFPSGWLVSSIYDVDPCNPAWGIMTWEADILNETLKFKVRTDATPDMGGAVPWDSCAYVTKGQDISDLNSVSDGQRFVQYRIEMSTTHGHRSPLVYEVSIEYSEQEGVAEGDAPGTGVVFGLSGPQPNPMGSHCSIEYSLDHHAEVNLGIYDAAGRLVRSLEKGIRSAGLHRTSWDGNDSSGTPVASGVYFARLAADQQSDCNRIVVLR